MIVRFRLPLVFCSSVILVCFLVATTASAQLGGINLPEIGIKLPLTIGSGKTADAAEQAAEKYVNDQIAKALGVDVPLRLDEKTAFPFLPQPPNGFVPIKLQLQR